MSHLQHVVLLGGLEPAFRVLFSVIFHDDFLGISIRVQSSGFAEEKLSRFVAFICATRRDTLRHPFQYRPESGRPAFGG